MRKVLLVAFILLGIGLIPLTRAVAIPLTEASGDMPTQEVLLEPEHVYVPMGFDSNDHVEAVIEGGLQDLCHKAPFVRTKRIGNKIFVEFGAQREVDPNSNCADLWVPVVEKVSLGRLPAGDYEIIVNPGRANAVLSDLSVAQADVGTTDNHIYANVEIVESVKGPTRKFLLKGYNPSDCLELDRVDFVYNEKDTLAVLPIMKQVRQSCPMKMIPFEYEIDVPIYMPMRKFLIHTRAMDGKSVNAIYRRTI